MIPRTIECDFVFLLDLVARMGEAQGEIAVVGENEQTFALGIEPADVEDPRQVRRKKIVNRVARVCVAARGDKPRGLVQDDVEPLLRPHHFAADFDVIARLRLHTEVGADATVDCNPAGGDQFVAMAARTNPGGGEITVQAHES